MRSPEPLFPSDSRSDQELIARINGGDPAAFDALYYRYRDWVVRLARRFTGNDDDALDVLQETFVYLSRKFPGFRLTSAMTTFLYPAVKNTALALCRKRSRYTSDEAALAQAADPRPDPPDAPAGRGELAAAMAGLPEAHRETLLMRFVDDMSLEEIAEALEVPVGTVKSRLHNAIKMLREDERTKEYFAAGG